MKLLDNFLNKITMYRLVLYYLIFLVLVAFGFSVFNILSFDPLELAFSVLFILEVCFITNKVFAYVFEAPTNLESVYISALILALIVTPPKNVADLAFLFWVSVFSMALKYILAIRKKHIFNPVAIAGVITALFIHGSFSWWIGTGVMAPFVFMGSVIVRKIRRYDLVLYFFISSLLTIVTLSFFKGSDPVAILRKTFLDSPILFLAFIMLTEPLTTPPTKGLQSIYGVLVGFLFAPQLRVASLYTTPELALIIGNIFSYVVSPKQKLMLVLQKKVKIAPDIYDFVFSLEESFKYKAGQYLEWTLAHDGADSRGNRRYFTLSSSPSEKEIRIGVKFYPQASSFKRNLAAMKKGMKINASQLAGDFTLPKEKEQKLVFVAGGIGITPFRSMVKYLLDIGEKRDIVILYSNHFENEIVYKDIFDEAKQKFGIETFYNVTEKEGRVTGEMIQKEIPDYKERLFYLSGPHSMVTGFEETLKSIDVEKRNIKTDYFPGLV